MAAVSDWDRRGSRQGAKKHHETRDTTMAHTIFCRTIDEVNGNLAQFWCDELRLTCQASFPREILFPTDGDGLVIDLDSLGLTPAERLQLAQQLCRTLLPYPVALSSYDLEPEMIGALQAVGVLVSRRLDRDLFERLAGAIEAKSEAA
jgi:hypothetical protein